LSAHNTCLSGKNCSLFLSASSFCYVPRTSVAANLD
jgi:hypothetical protein